MPAPGYPNVEFPYAELLVYERAETEVVDRVVGDEVIHFKVKELLDGVDLTGVRATVTPGTKERPKRGIKLFYSYSHKDEALRDQLETHLKIFDRQGLIESWYDRRISAGTEWKGQIDTKLEQADIILLLISANFIASDYCYDIECTRALKRHQAGLARVIPIIVRDCHWQRERQFRGLKALPPDGKAVDTWRNRNIAWNKVADGIQQVIDEFHSS